MSKSRRVSAPGRLGPGVGSRLARVTTMGADQVAAAAAVRGHICRGLPTVNRLVRKIRNRAVIILKSLGFPCFPMSSGRLDVTAQRLGLRLDPLDSMLHQVADRDDSPNLSA